SVTNSGTVDRVLSNSNQFLITSDGERRSADYLARFYLNDGLWETITQGSTVTGTIVFDIPADATPRALELHERPESKGVTIQL
ncbi:DUF4352 domain-containing protein, partial [Frankia sp. EI5c]|uniref:DUF4352 domain-containing protein n=1 Tax=Frankia sp. EI5c TaxID=683316 RepID=UPI001F5B0A11